MRRVKAIRVVIAIIIIMGMIAILLPLYIALVTSLKTPAESARSAFSLPKHLNMSNFGKVISGGGFFRSLLNSFLVTIASVGVMSTLTPIVAYALSRNHRNRISNVVYYYFILGMFIPFHIVMFPIITTMSRLRMLNLWGLIILYASLSIPKTVFLYYAYLKSIPTELDESAYMDGAGVIKIFTKVIYPLLAPMTATVIIIQSLWVWNDFLLPLIILNRTRSYFTLPLFQYRFIGEYYTDFNIIFAAVMISMIPMMVVYLSLQKYMINGLIEGAVKG